MSDYSTLIASLPSATVSALATTPQGIDATAHVYVSDNRRSFTEATEAWWRQVEHRSVADGLSGSLVSYVFELRLSKAGGTRAELEAWLPQIRSYFHGQRKPATTGVVAANVLEAMLDEHPGEGPCVEALCRIEFVMLAGLGAEFSPSQITGLLLWVDPSDAANITSSGGLVSAAANKVASGVPASLTAAGSVQPTLTADAFLSSVAGLTCDGADDELAAASAPVLTSDLLWTIFAVFRPTDLTTLRSGFVINMPGTIGHIRMSVEGAASPKLSLSVQRASTPAASLIIQPLVVDTTYVVCFRQTAIDARSVMVNGTETTNTTTLNATANAHISFSYGGGAVATTFEGVLGELLVYDGALSDTHRTTVLNYLNSKWRGV